MTLDTKTIQDLFVTPGGQFTTAPESIVSKLAGIKAFIFDWDGVFNSSHKTEAGGSPFSEADAMGTNLLRFGYWLTHGELPHTAILTGENNPAAIHLAKREHFSAIYYKTKDKATALEHMQNQLGIAAREIAFCFDDVLDLPVAKSCGLRFLIKRSGSPLFERYVKSNAWCDYISGNDGASHAVREICELVLGLSGQFAAAVDKRCDFDSDYRRYWQLRNSHATAVFSQQSNKLITEEPPKA